ncbi:MAG TPA: SpoIIE family protein phosphatase [Acidobacteriaceae bacterium]
MPSRTLRILLFCASFWASALCISQTPQPLAVTIGAGAVPLAGPWEFHVGDDPSWASPTLDDSQWERLDAAKSWGDQGHASYTGFAWYRRTLDLTPEAGISPDFALLIPHIDDAYELYWNGQLIGRNGQMPPHHPVWYLNVPAQTFSLGPVPKGVLAIRVWKVFLSSRDTGLTGGFAAPPVAGSPQSIARWKAQLDYEWLRTGLFSDALYSLYGFVGFLGLIAWLRDRSQWLLFWTSVFLTMPFLEVAMIDWRFHIAAPVAVGLHEIVVAINNISLWYLLCWLLDLHGNRRLMRTTRIAAIAMVTLGTLDALIVGWPTSYALPAQIADAIVTAAIILLQLYNLVPVIVAIARKRKVDHSRWLFAGITTFAQTLYVVWLATQQGARFTHWTISQKIVAIVFTIYGSQVSLLSFADALTFIALLYAVWRYSMETISRKNILEQEFSNAREIQQILIPDELPEVKGYLLTSAYVPAQEVGGDFFQIIPLKTGATLILLGDVSGKGLRAAMAVSLIVGAARTLAETTTWPAEIMAGLNRRLFGRLQGGFTTCVALRIDPVGNCTIASAGHPSPFVNGIELPLPGAFPLGLLLDTVYEETSFRLNVNDHLILYTDGLLEARNRSRELYGFDRLQTLFAKNPTAGEASQQAIAFGQDDDITVLTITRLPLGERSTTQVFFPNFKSTAA